jgi:hypothetical protein
MESEDLLKDVAKPTEGFFDLDVRFFADLTPILVKALGF